MLYLAIFIYCFATALSSAVQNPILSGGGTATTVRIPGNTNARYCSDREHDLFMIERVDLVPNPPIPDVYMTMQIWGWFNEDLGPDAYVDFFLTVDGSVSIDYTFELCNTYHLDTWQWLQGEQPGRSCPPKEGFAEITYTTRTPAARGHDGNWTARADFLTKDKRSIFCLEGWVLWPPANVTEPM